MQRIEEMMGLWPNEHRNLTVEKSTEDKEVKLDSATAIFTTQLVKKKERLQIEFV